MFFFFCFVCFFLTSGLRNGCLDGFADPRSLKFQIVSMIQVLLLTEVCPDDDHSILLKALLALLADALSKIHHVLDVKSFS